MGFNLRYMLVLALGLAACAGPQVSTRLADRADPADRVLRTRLEFVDRTYRAIPDSVVEQDPRQRTVYPYVVFHDPIDLNFYAVPGRLAGMPERFFRIRLKRTYAQLEAGTQKDFAVSLAAVERMLAERASVYVPRPEDSDFSVQPADTRFARLILSAGDPFTYPYSEREAGFVDRGTEGRFVLLYVDRPCRIAGTIQANDGLFRHQLVFERAGLHWLRIWPTAGGGARVTQLDPEGPVSVYVRYPDLRPE